MMRACLPIAAVLSIALGTAHAQTACPDGRTFTGACVKAELGEGVRKQVSVGTQPKISYTAPPLLPSEDGTYAVPYDYHELRTIYGIGAASPVTCVPTRTNPC